MNWSYDPDPSDNVTTTESAFLLRHGDGRVVHVLDVLSVATRNGCTPGIVCGRRRH